MSQDLEARLADLERQVTQLSDRAAIQDIIHRYCRAADRCDEAALRACYWPDGFDDHGFFGGNAMDFVDYIIPVLKQIEASVHAITNTIIDFKGDQAFCESQWSVVHRLRDGVKFYDFWHNGRYLDIFEKRNGEWRILTRTAATDMDRLVRTTEMRAKLADFDGAARRGPDNNLPRGARYPADPVYVGFDLPNLVKTRDPIADLWTGFYALEKIL